MVVFFLFPELEIFSLKLGKNIIFAIGNMTQYQSPKWAKKPPCDIFLSLNVVLISVNSADPDEMQDYAVAYLGLHCLPKQPFRGSKYTKG